MSHEPKDLAASVRFRLLQIARESHRDFDSILLLFMQERLLYRISSSRFCDAFVLKGGFGEGCMGEVRGGGAEDGDCFS